MTPPTPELPQATPLGGKDFLVDQVPAMRDDYDLAPCGLFSLDSDMRLRRINDNMLRWLGRDRGELAYFESDWNPDFSLLAGVHNRAATALLREHVNGLRSCGSPARIEITLFGNEGRAFTLEVTSVGVFDTAGRLTHTRSSAVDVDVRLRVDQVSLTRRALLQRMVDRAPSRLAYYNNDLVCEFSSASHARIHGLSPADMVGLHLSESLSQGELPEVLPKLVKVLKGEKIHLQTERLDAQGQRHVYGVRFLPDFEEGHVVGFFAELEDIAIADQTPNGVELDTNLELEELIAARTEEILRSGQRHRLMFEAMIGYGVFFLDLDGSVVEWTDSVVRLHGFKREEVMGRRIDALVLPTGAEDDASSVRDINELLSRCIKYGLAEREGWCARSDGSRFWGNYMLTALRDPMNELLGISCMVRDSSDAKRMSDLSRQVNRQLSLTVAETSSALERANRDQEMLSYTVAHDLRTPLRHIAQFVQLSQELLVEDQASPVSPLLLRIAGASQRMRKMIEEMMEYTRISQAEMRMTGIPLAALTTGIVAHMHAEIGDREIEWLIDPMLPVVRADPILLGEALGKLLDNAVKFTRHVPRARIEVSIEVVLDERAVVCVKDNGVGFDLKRARNLFHMFQRQHHSLDYEGTGTGLALARRILERHDGGIWCETAKDQGCRFFVELPLAGTEPVESHIET